MSHGIHFMHKKRKTIKQKVSNNSKSKKTSIKKKTNKSNLTNHEKHVITHNKHIDNLATLVAILMPFTTIPQIHKIWVLQNTGGVSIWTWGLYFLMCIPMVIYGIFYKMAPIIILNLLWMLMNLIIIIGLIIY